MSDNRVIVNWINRDTLKAYRNWEDKAYETSGLPIYFKPYGEGYSVQVDVTEEEALCQDDKLNLYFVLGAIEGFARSNSSPDDYEPIDWESLK